MKPSNAYNDAIQDTFNLVEFKKNNSMVMGTASQNFNYPADYDLFEIVKTSMPFDKLKKMVSDGFQRMAKAIKQDKNAYFIELMCGVDDDKKALKWSLNEIIKGKKDKYLLDDVLNEHSVMKLEIVIYHDSRFVPISNVYEFKNNGKGINQAKTTKDDIDSLIVDIKKYHEKKNYMKVLKRLYLIAQQKKNDKLTNTLKNIFQSDLGKLNMIKSNIEAMIEVLNADYKGTELLNKMKATMQILKEETSKTGLIFSESWYKQFDKINNMKTSKSMIKGLEKVKTMIDKYVQKHVLKQIKTNRIKYKMYIK